MNPTRTTLASSASPIQAPPRTGGTLAAWQVVRATELVERNLDVRLTLDQMAATCRLSTSHFARCFKRSTGLAPYQWILRRRLLHAAQLMHDPQMTLADIAAACGFADQSHLGREFRRLIGCSPAAWRRQQDSLHRVSSHVPVTAFNAA